MLLNVSTKGSIASFETLGVAMAESHFGISPGHAGTVVSICGSIGVFFLLSMGFFQDRFNDVQIISGGMVVMAIGIASLSLLEESGENSHWRYALAIFLIYAVGYPIGHTAGMSNAIIAFMCAVMYFTLNKTNSH